MLPHVDRIAATAEDRTAAGIAAAVNRLIKSGELPVGSRLPTVRVLAQALGTSPTTVNEAWRSLVRIGAVHTRGRNGSFVADGRRASRPSRFWRIASAAGEFARDLSSGVPDPELLPALPGLARGPRLSGYLDSPVLPALERLIRGSWGHDPECLTVVDGSLDAVDRVLTSLLSLGDVVVVENPTFPPFLDLLEMVGARPLPVATDTDGMVPDALRAALADGGVEPTAVLLQPRAHNPTGASLTPARAGELARVLRTAAPGCVVVEDDHIGDIAVADPVSLAAWLPDRTVTARSFSKAYGPDLRLAALGGPATLVEPVIARRNLGPAWSSRLLQQLLADMLADRGCAAAVARAREVYARRREALVAALAGRGVPVVGRDGFNLWLPVEHERDALVVLAAQGIGAAPGQPFLAAPVAGDHLRITTATLAERDAAPVADALADAARRGERPLHR
ncbi:MAG TPA: aminotransferase class I/II-fold pyridoxal phosphate-dependent enzyme [Pseudonocardia sp.]